MIATDIKPALCSIYQCFNARVKYDAIYCAKRHCLGQNKEGTVDIKRLMRGEPMELRICQLCKDFDEMGPSVSKEDRGWLKLELSL